MFFYYDENAPILLDKSIVSDSFVNYFNEYVEFCRKRGAEVYFSYCPMNELAILNPDEDSILEFEDYLKDSLECKIISNIEEYILEPEYFYDSNFHLNDAGKIRHSVDLTEDILLELDIQRLVEAPFGQVIPGLVTVPEPSLPFVDVRCFEYDDNSVYFEY